MLVEIRKFNKKEINVCTSLDVSETFEKLHKDVLDSIRNIQADLNTAEFSALFYEAEYKGKIETAEHLAGSLMDYGWGYNAIKDFILNQATQYVSKTAYIEEV